MKNRTWVIAAAAGSLALGGCAYHGGSADYRGYEVRGEQSVRFGVVESVREVRISPRETGVGTAGGAVLGSIKIAHRGGQNHHPGRADIAASFTDAFAETLD